MAVFSLCPHMAGGAGGSLGDPLFKGTNPITGSSFVTYSPPQSPTSSHCLHEGWVSTWEFGGRETYTLPVGPAVTGLAVGYLASWPSGQAGGHGGWRAHGLLEIAVLFWASWDHLGRACALETSGLGSHWPRLLSSPAWGVPASTPGASLPPISSVWRERGSFGR